MKIDEKVYKKLLQVPTGKVTTYSELAKAVGLKDGQRIIGKIMNKNPYPVIVPCHRVVKANG
ncbi:MAG: MGMT family protein, partial [Nitrosopumilaceae archaeon]